MDVKGCGEAIRDKPASLHKWEAGKTSPHPHNVKRLCEIYGMSPGELDLEMEEEKCIHLPIEEQPEGNTTAFFQDTLEFRLHCLIYQALTRPQTSRAALQVRMNLEIGNTMQQHQVDLSRRETLCRLAWLPVQALGLGALSTITIPGQSGDILTHCAAGIVACEHLSKGKHEDITTALTALSSYLPPLSRIVKDDSANRKEVARLATQALLIKATLSIHREGTEQALRYAQQALTYSEESGDISLQLVILRRSAYIHFCAKQHSQA